jgi:hypothetical protein
MKTFLLTLAAVGALTAAAPAAAQDWRGRGDSRDGLQWRIERAEQRGALDRRESWRLRAQLREADRMEWRYGRDGFISRWEREDLHQRYAQISDQLRDAVGDGHGYGGRYDDHYDGRGGDHDGWRH